MLGPLAGQQAQQASGASPTLWDPGESATLLGAYLGWDRGSQTISGNEITSHSCSYGTGPDFVPSSLWTEFERPTLTGPDGTTQSSVGSKDTVWLSEPTVIQTTDLDTTSRPRILVWLIDVTSFGEWYFVFDCRPSGNPHTIVKELSDFKWYDPSGSTAAPNGSGLPLGTHILTIRTDGAGNSDVRVDGVDAYSVDRAPLGGSLAADLALYQTIYGNRYRSDRGVACHMGAVAFDYDTSGAQVERYEGWLAHETGLTSLLPSGHPYKSVPPTT